MIDLSYFKFCKCEKVGGLGETPRINSFSYCFHYYFPSSIFCFPLYSFSILRVTILFTTRITIQVIFAVLSL